MATPRKGPVTRRVRVVALSRDTLVAESQTKKHLLYFSRWFLSPSAVAKWISLASAEKQTTSKRGVNTGL